MLGDFIKFLLQVPRAALAHSNARFLLNVVASITINDLILSPLNSLIELIKATYMLQIF